MDFEAEVTDATADMHVASDSDWCAAGDAAGRLDMAAFASPPPVAPPGRS